MTSLSHCVPLFPSLNSSTNVIFIIWTKCGVKASDSYLVLNFNELDRCPFMSFPVLPQGDAYSNDEFFPAQDCKLLQWA